MEKHQILEYLQKCQHLQASTSVPISVSTYFDDDKDNRMFLVVSANINGEYVLFCCYEFYDEEEVRMSYEDFVKAIGK